MTTVRISTKGQIVLPADLRRRYGLKPGGEVQIVDAEDHLVVVPRADSPVRDLRGLLRGGDSLTAALLATRKTDRERE